MLSDTVALSLALIGPPLVLKMVTGARPFSAAARLTLWGLAAAALIALTAHNAISQTMARIGLGHFDARSVVFGMVGVDALAGAAAAVIAIQRIAGIAYGDSPRFALVAALSFPRRLFLVVTAAVVEEVLYRGVGIGVGRDRLGGVTTSALVSAVAFTLAHFRWRASHLPVVAASACVLGALFALSGDLWSCIIAHFVFDGVGLIIAPAAMRRRPTQPPQV